MSIKEIIYDWSGYNTKIFYAINGINGGEFYQKIMQVITNAGYYRMFIVYFPLLVIIALIANREGNAEKIRKWKESLFTLLGSYLLSLVWISTLKHHFGFPRPFAALPDVHVAKTVLLTEAPMVSFPSGHSSFSMLMAVGLWPVLNMPGKILISLYVILVGFSRIALGAHFPADVALSFTISFIVAYVVNRLVRKFV